MAIGNETHRYEREEEMLMHARIQTQLLKQLVELLGKQTDPDENPYGDTGFGKLYKDTSDFKLNLISDKITKKRSEYLREDFLAYYSQPLRILNAKQVMKLAEEIYELGDEYKEKYEELLLSGKIKESEGTAS